MLSQLDFDDPCPWCGRPLDRTNPHSIKRKFCSIECQRADYHQTEKNARLEAKAGRPPCRRCGALVLPWKDARAVFCSHECQSAGGAAKVCANCGVPFMGIGRRKFCTIRCAALHRERIRGEAAE